MTNKMVKNEGPLTLGISFGYKKIGSISLKHTTILQFDF
jgi:hypothetical protein